MSYWGGIGEAVEETVVSGGAGAVGLVPGVGEIGAAAIHGVDAGAHYLAGDTHTAQREAGMAVGSAIPAAGKVVAALDIAQAPVNATAGVVRAAGGEMPTTGEMINEMIWGHGAHAESGGHE